VGRIKNSQLNPLEKGGVKIGILTTLRNWHPPSERGGWRLNASASGIKSTKVGRGGGVSKKTSSHNREFTTTEWQELRSRTLLEIKIPTLKEMKN